MSPPLPTVRTFQIEGTFTGRTADGSNLPVRFDGTYDCSTIPWPRAPGAGFETVLFLRDGDGPQQVALTHWPNESPEWWQAKAELEAGHFRILPGVKGA